MNPWGNHTVSAGNSEFLFSAHIVKRSQQRAVSLELVKAAIKYGEHCYQNGADLYILGKNANIPKDANISREDIEKLQRRLLYVLVASDSGAIMTTYWRDRPNKNKSRRKKSLWRGQRQ